MLQELIEGEIKNMTKVPVATSFYQGLSFLEVIRVDGNVDLDLDHIITSGSKDLNNALCYIVLPSEMGDR